MISEERLKELLKEEATIYRVNGYVEEIGLNEYDFGTTDKELVFNYKIYAIRIEDLFETEEEAKEYLKYGNITRTEKFPYVSWEEFIDGDRIIFYDNDGIRYVLKTYFDGIYLENTFSQKQLIYLSPITRKNYHKALDLAVKLFKGEEV